MGTLERDTWREGLERPKAAHEAMSQMHPFKSYQTLQRSMVGWFPKDQEPPLEPPPPSKEWVKSGKSARAKG
jgi:hypothetical protein